MLAIHLLNMFKVAVSLSIPLAAAFVLILLNACFVATEFSLVKIRRTRLEELSKEGIKSAKSALFCVDNLNRMMSVTQLGITLASLTLGWVAQSWFANVLAPLLPDPFISRGPFQQIIGGGLSLIFLTLFHVVLGELVPKNIAIYSAERTLLIMARPLRAFALFTHPLIQIFTRIATTVLRWLGYEGMRENPLSEEELKLVMEDSREGGVLSEGEVEIINRAFVFADKQAKDIMVPASKVDLVSLQKSFGENLALIKGSRHTRFPLCNGGLDDLIGIVHIKDILIFAGQSPSNQTLQEISRDTLFVLGTMKQDKLLQHLKYHRTHLAVVRDDNGKNIGIVTLEDILEGLVGELEEGLLNQPITARPPSLERAQRSR
jgi:CBS domain containing-hemolysin-like protein